MAEQDVKDAQRYRWLVGGRTAEQTEKAQQPAQIPQDEVIATLATWYVTKERADALIDAVMAGGTGNG